MKNRINKTRNILQQIQIRLILFLFAGVIFLINCTENPFSDVNKISQNIITGRVELENYPDPSDVFVWFKALNVSARTDSTGHFALSIPSPSQQPGGGIDGIFDLYFYVSNYQLGTIKIAMTRGNIQSDNQTLDNNGKLKATVILSELLNINTSFSSKSISESNVDTIYATFSVLAKKDPVKIMTDSSSPDFPGDPTFMTGFLLDSTKNFIKILKREDKAHRTITITVSNSAVALKRLAIPLPQGEIQSGEYYVVPYILVEQDLPAGLVNSIGQNVTKYTQDFMKIPLKIHNNKFTL